MEYQNYRNIIGCQELHGRNLKRKYFPIPSFQRTRRFKENLIYYNGTSKEQKKVK